MRNLFLTFVRNGLSMTGAAIASAMAALFVVLAILNATGLVANPYLGLVFFGAVPVVFVGALLLIPIGLWRQRRLEARHPEAVRQWPVVDLGQPRQRVTAIAVLALTVVNLMIVSLAAYGGVHYMETREFCGQVCHTTMEPEYVAHQGGPHSRVACVECHVGSGAGALIESKLQGLHQLRLVMTNRVPKPVPPPLRVMRPATETCEQCHWPEKFHGDRQKVIRAFASDEQNTESTTTLTLHLGGGSARLGIGTGIHWHMNLDNVVEFASADADRQVIPFVRVRNSRGEVREFVAKGADVASLRHEPLHRMDCVDCHNRPAHTFAATPERALDEAIAQGRVPRDLPFLHREAMAALNEPYPSREAADAAIAGRLAAFYKGRPVKAESLARAVAGVKDVYGRNVFPAMRVTWGTYPNNIGHMDTPGCFRCHDDEHASSDGRTIRQDCETCHTAPS